MQKKASRMGAAPTTKEVEAAPAAAIEEAETAPAPAPATEGVGAAPTPAIHQPQKASRQQQQ